MRAVVAISLFTPLLRLHLRVLGSHPQCQRWLDQSRAVNVTIICFFFFFLLTLSYQRYLVESFCWSQVFFHCSQQSFPYPIGVVYILVRLSSIKTSKCWTLLIRTFGVEKIMTTYNFTRLPCPLFFYGVVCWMGSVHGAGVFSWIRGCLVGYRGPSVHAFQRSHDERILSLMWRTFR